MPKLFCVRIIREGYVLAEDAAEAEELAADVAIADSERVSVKPYANQITFPDRTPCVVVPGSDELLTVEAAWDIHQREDVPLYALP